MSVTISTVNSKYKAWLNPELLPVRTKEERIKRKEKQESGRFESGLHGETENPFRPPKVHFTEIEIYSGSRSYAKKLWSTEHLPH